jgi:hypothetical protein
MMPSEKDVLTQSDRKWDCSIHDFMKEFEDDRLLKESLEKTFTEFNTILSEIHKNGKRLFFILEKK